MDGKEKHRREDGRKVLYTVYDNRTDMPVCIMETAPVAAAAMGLTIGSFYCAASRRNIRRKWYIEKYSADTEEEV